MPPDAAEELLVAVGEAVTNAVLHGAHEAKDAPPEVRRERTTDRPGGDIERLRQASTGPTASAPAGSTADVVMVELLAHGDRVAVAVTSPSGRWRVPPAECPEPIAERGRGLYLMRHLADSVRIEQGRRGTTVYLIRRLRHGEIG
jgi:anti-sigma regulatory factor (Ser/Thr protein kinase)